MIIFTDDESVFRDSNFNEVFMYRTLDTIPDRKDTIYYLTTDRFGSDDVLSWHPIVANKLIIITTKVPRLNKKAKELCIVSDGLSKKETSDDTFLLIKALINWNDKKRVEGVFQKQPLPLVNWFLKGNYKDIDFWRRIADTNLILPEKYTRAAIIYGIRPSRNRVIWPRKQKGIKEKPNVFRDSDEHWELILENSISVANKVREVGDVPKGMRKTKVAESKWF
tara:strand:+ start:5534 stop:6202 length:669 start_codon:yes stop_codon:yes gene_type:complete